MVSAIPRGYFAPYGSGCAGAGLLPKLRGSGLPSPGGTARLDISGAVPKALAGIFFAINPDVPGTFCMHIKPPFIGPFVFSLDAAGAANLSARIPPGSPRDIHFYIQAMVAGGGAFSTSNGLDVHIK